VLGPSGNLASGSVPGASSCPLRRRLRNHPRSRSARREARFNFDARGALTSGNVTVFYLSAPGSPDSGLRAVLLMPAGSIQIWSGDSTGTWWQMR